MKEDSQDVIASMGKRNLGKLAEIERILKGIKVSFGQELTQFVRVSQLHYRLMTLWAIGLQMKYQIDWETKRKFELPELGHRMKLITKTIYDLFHALSTLDHHDFSTKMNTLVNFSKEYIRKIVIADADRYVFGIFLLFRVFSKQVDNNLPQSRGT